MSEETTDDVPPKDYEYHTGPVTLRGSRVPGTTTDQRLLDSRGSSEWLHTDPWRVMRIQSEFVEGFGALAELGPAVSVFGSARTKPGTPYYEIGTEVGRALVDAGYAVMARAVQQQQGGRGRVRVTEVAEEHLAALGDDQGVPIG